MMLKSLSNQFQKLSKTHIKNGLGTVRARLLQLEDFDKSFLGNNKVFSDKRKASDKSSKSVKIIFALLFNKINNSIDDYMRNEGNKIRSLLTNLSCY